MKGQRVAIIGAGTAGLAVASFLQLSGHKVIIYEKFSKPKPLGAGLLIQPTGLAILSLLGLDKEIIENGSRIDQLYGKVSGARRVTLDVKYRSFASHLFGVGTHRGNLFSVLYSKVNNLNIEICAGQEIQDIKDILQQYDLVIDCSGSKSAFRKTYADIKLDRPYPYGAIWSIVKLTNDKFRPDTLDQRYKNAKHMIGVLPVGQGNAAFFWSLKTADYEKWRSQDLREWQDYVASLWPETRDLVSQFKTHDDLTMASYRDVVLKKYHHGNIVFIGDSAHCTSPQLGQGANLALVDAYVLSQCLNNASSLQEALENYTKQRKWHIQFYQMASRYLTPFFQSDSWLFAKLRFFTCDLACKFPISQIYAAQVLSGIKNGIFSKLDPGIWSPDYALKISS